MTQQELKTLFEELRLKTFPQTLDQILDRHPNEREIILESLRYLCDLEISKRREGSIAYRIEQAKFGQIQTVDTFDFNYNPSTLKIKNRYLKLLKDDITQEGLSVLFVGSSGLGKTHLSKALGYALCQKRVRIRFTELSSMSVDLTTADAVGTLKKTMALYVQPALLIIDEIGYVTLRELESNLVFQIISQRYANKRSTVITTNRPFGEWNQVFHNDAMAHALLDRLIERSEVFHLEGKSYRETHRKRSK